MNISVNTAQFAKKLKLVEKIVAQKATIPILSNVLIRAELGEVRLSTTNTEVSMTTACPAQVNTSGAITVPVKTLLDIVSQITDDQTHLMIEKDKVRLAAGAFKMRLSTLTAEDFPRLPEMPDGGMLLPGDTFRDMIRKVRYAISDADKRYFMNGALLSLTEHAIALVATDGKRLALTATKRPAPGEALEIVIPTKTLDVLLSDDGHDDLMFNKDARQMFFVSEDTILTSRTLDGTFPNYKRIIPTDNPLTVQIPRAGLLAALKRVSLAADNTSALILTLEDNALSLASANAQLGDAFEHLPIAYSGKVFKTMFNWTFIMDFLNAATHPTVKLALKDATTASLWSDGDGAELMNVIMQMRA